MRLFSTALYKSCCLDLLFFLPILKLQLSLSAFFHTHSLSTDLFATAGCENGCSRHGQCTLENGEYRCDCIEGWAGSDCSIALEMNCKDNIDNDGGKYKVNTQSEQIICNLTRAQLEQEKR